jgi:hypothetical protein
MVRRAELGPCGTLSLASAGICGLLAAQHASLRDAICGAGHIPHCGWCVGAAGFALAGLAALYAAARPDCATAR